MTNQIQTIHLNPSTGVLTKTTSIPPTAPPSTHLLSIHAAALTNGELSWAPYSTWTNPHVPAYDVSGTILTTLPSSPFQIGDAIYAKTDARYHEGFAREVGYVNLEYVARKPRNLSMVEAASVPTSGLTAWQGLFEHGGLKAVDADGKGIGDAKGKRVLVTAASGGVGVYAVQLAKLAGATVVGTCGKGNVEFVRGLGADEAVDYKKGSMKDWVGGDEERRFDVVLHCAADFSGETLRDCGKVLKKGGRLVSIVMGFEVPEGLPEGATAMFFILKSRGDQLGKMAELFEKGLLRAHVDSVWKLEQFQEAFDRVGSGRARGRVVLQIRGE